MKNKVCIVVTIIMVMMLAQFSLFIGNVKAETITGSDGTVSWSFDSETGTITFSGSGEISGVWKENINERNINNVTISDGITSIGSKAFWGCTMTSITIPNSVTSIGSKAFTNCTRLENIAIPDSFTSIGDQAFSYCGIKSITIPNTVTSIGGYAFDGCYKLTSITIPNSVTNIGDSAFKDCKMLNSITISDSVINIGSYAFVNCESLISITIPNSVKSIDSSAFDNCSSLTNISVSPQNEDYSSENGVLFNKDKTEICKYPAAKEETTYIIPNGVKRIGARAFIRCETLKNITIPNTVTSIGEYAFNNCINLTKMILPASVERIDSYIFEYDDGLIVFCKSNTKPLIPDNVTCVVDDDIPTVELSQEGLYINIVASDLGVGLTAEPYSIDGTNWYENNKIAVDKSGEYIVYVRDLLNNIAEKSIMIDIEKPKITNIMQDRYKITITATDNIALAEKAYSIDGVNYQSSNVFTVPKNGIYSIYVKDSRENIVTETVIVSVTSDNKDNEDSSEDNKNNGETSINDKDDDNKEKNSQKDIKAPIIHSVEANGLKITIKATDDVMLAEKPYSLDNKTWQSSNEITVEKNGQYMVYVRDKAGNVANKLVKVTTKQSNDTNNSKGNTNSKTSTETKNVEKAEDKTQAKTKIPQTGATFPIVILIVVSVIGVVGYKKFKKVNY